MSWRPVYEWRYGSTILDLGTRWSWVVSLTPLLRYALGNTSGNPLHRRLDAMEKRQIFPLQAIERWLVAIPTELSSSPNTRNISEVILFKISMYDSYSVLFWTPVVINVWLRVIIEWATVMRKEYPSNRWNPTWLYSGMNTQSIAVFVQSIYQSLFTCSIDFVLGPT
jgi:hypothetical protein